MVAIVATSTMIAIVAIVLYNNGISYYTKMHFSIIRLKSV